MPCWRVLGKTAGHQEVDASATCRHGNTDPTASPKNVPGATIVGVRACTRRCRQHTPHVPRRRGRTDARGRTAHTPTSGTKR
eukprot:12927284-Prorocentrum_lima.AAC.1